MPRPATTVARGTGSIGPRLNRLTQIFRSSPTVLILTHQGQGSGTGRTNGHVRCRGGAETRSGHWPNSLRVPASPRLCTLCVYWFLSGRQRRSIFTPPLLVRTRTGAPPEPSVVLMPWRELSSPVIVNG